MRLLKYKVNKFRSVKETEWIETDQWTCFVGVNESGKTNLLLPLWKFNPAERATRIDLLEDYPRDEYSEVNTDGGFRKNQPFIEVLFELSAKEIDHFNGQVGSSTDHQEPVAEKPEPNLDSELQTVTIPEFAPAASLNPSSKSGDITFSKMLLVKKDYNENFSAYISNENAEQMSGNLSEIIDQKLFDDLCQRLPKFVYYSEYGNLDSDIYLPRVKEDLENVERLSGKERMRARTLKILFNYLKLNPDEILALGLEKLTNTESATSNNTQNHGTERVKARTLKVMLGQIEPDEVLAIEEEAKTGTQMQQHVVATIDQESRNKQKRFAKVASAAAQLSGQFKELWSQGDYKFHFNADGEYFRILVSDGERPSPIELEARSKGLQWFFSFFLVFLAESADSHRDCILLLDEPGLSLHPNAQADLIRFFSQLSEKNQLIYTTHLPFMVDYNNLDRIKPVYTDNGCTKVSNDIGNASKEKNAVKLISTAIEISAANSLLGGCDIVIVKSVPDQIYLTMIKNYLISRGQFKPKKDLAFLPVAGVKSVQPVISIIRSRSQKLPICLLTSDETGRKFQEELKSGAYAGDTDKILETDSWTGKSGSEIEDIIPAEMIVDSFDRLFYSEEGIDMDAIDLSLPIVPQLEKFAGQNSIALDLNWKIDLSQRVKQRLKKNLDEKDEALWADLFSKLQ